MSINDRNWMHRRLENDRITLTKEYREGVEIFLGFAKKNGMDGNLMKCPCKNCINSNWHTLDDVRYHLIANGISLDYKVWNYHGENAQNRQAQRPSKRRRVGSGEEPVDMDGILRDIGIENHNFADDVGGSRVEEPPNKSASEFLNEVNKSGCPIYPENIKYTKLSFSMKLLQFKSFSRCSEKAFNLLLQTIGDVLPPKHTLPSTYYEVKKMIKNLKLSYNKIDVCENDCMLFYGDDIDKIVCDHCQSDRYKDFSKKKSARKIPKKVLRHFPIIPRLQRLFMSVHTAKHMTWYKNREVKEGQLSHPSDGDDWKNFDRQHPSFASEIRNVRLGLSTDGFNPFGNSGNNVYTVWPVVIVVYNLPPSMGMKRPYMFLNLIIPGPYNTSKDLNVYLRPLIDELKILWHNGVETFDQFKKNNFQMRAALMWTISDFPALAQLKGWSTKGKMGCPVCLGSVKGFQLKNCGKCCFFCTNRIFLDENDYLRKKGSKFASTERNVFRGRVSGEYEKSFCEGLEFPPPGKFSRHRALGYGKEHNWTNMSMFFELEYWTSLGMRHCIDVMHTEKNMFDNLFYTIVDDRKKTKDHDKSRNDCKELGVMSGLWLKDGVKPKARYTLTRPQLRLLCEWVSDLKLPDGCCSNLKRCIKKDLLKFHGLKSHDCHIFMQKLMTIAFREFLPRDIMDALAALSNYFVDICSTILLRSDLEILEKSIVKTLCVLETIFPPSFFDIMEHLVLHLAEECRLGGPVHYRWMYPFERLLKYMKDKVKNKARVEGSIAEAYAEEEIVNFCSFYFSSNVDTVHTTVGRNEVVVENTDESVLEVFRYPIEYMGKQNVRSLDKDEIIIAEYYVLLNMPEVQPYIREYASYTRATPEQLESLLKTQFKQWFKNKIKDDHVIYKRFKHLLHGPARTVFTFEGCKVNGYKFHCKDNYGVLVKGTSHVNILENYYGQLEEIIRLNYQGGNHVYLFKCRWFDSAGSGVRVDKNRVVTVDMKSRLRSNESRYGAILESRGVDLSQLTESTELDEPIELWLTATTGTNDKPKKNRIIGFPTIPAGRLLSNLAHHFRENTRGGASSSSSSANRSPVIPDPMFINIVRNAVTSAQANPDQFGNLNNSDLEEVARNLIEVADPASRGSFNQVFFREVVNVVTTIFTSICNDTQAAIDEANKDLTDEDEDIDENGSGGDDGSGDEAGGSGGDDDGSGGKDGEDEGESTHDDGDREM